MLNVLTGSGSTKIAKHAVQRNNERENDFQAFFRIKSNLGLIAVARALTMRAFIAGVGNFSSRRAGCGKMKSLVGRIIT